MDFKGVLKKFISLNSMHLNEKLWKREKVCVFQFNVLEWRPLKKIKDVYFNSMLVSLFNTCNENF